jgi:hypothetical protein
MIFCELAAGVVLCSSVALLWVVASKVKGGLILESFLALALQKKIPCQIETLSIIHLEPLSISTWFLKYLAQKI